jgi:glycosyltransferase involved in cell wall biosynthesis
MKVCILTNVFAPEKDCPPKKVGGAEVCAERISRNLAENGHTVVIITQRNFNGIGSLLPKLDCKGQMKIYSFFPLNIFSIYNAHKKPFFLKGLWRLADLFNFVPAILIHCIIRKEKPDIINNHIIHGFSPFFLVRLLKKTGIPLAQTIHSYGFICPKCDLLRRGGVICIKPAFFCTVFRKVSAKITDRVFDRVIFPSSFSLGVYQKFGFFSTSNKIVLPNGIEISDHNPHKPYRTKTDYFRILYAGRLVRIKGVHILISAFRQLSYKEALLYITGEGSYEKTLKEMAAGDRRIHFLSKQSWLQLKELYTTCDVTVLPSIYYEILGNVLLESLASGTAVIGSRIGGIPEIIQDGINGFLLNPGEVITLKELLKYCIEHPEQLALMGHNAFLSARRYDLRMHIQKLEGIYRGAIDEHL